MYLDFVADVEHEDRLKRHYDLENYLTPRHFDAMAKLILVTGTIVAYSYLTEYFISWYSVETPERAAFWNRAFGDYWWASWIMITCNAIIPMLLWSKKMRTNIAALFTITVFVNIGIWFERYVIIVTSLSHEYELLRGELESAGEMIERLGKELELS